MTRGLTCENVNNVLTLSSPASHMFKRDNVNDPNTSGGASFAFFALMTNNTSRAFSRNSSAPSSACTALSTPH